MAVFAAVSIHGLPLVPSPLFDFNSETAVLWQNYSQKSQRLLRDRIYLYILSFAYDQLPLNFMWLVSVRIFEN